MKRTKETIASTDWLVRGLTDAQLQTEKTLVLIAGEIYLRRLELGMDQKQFAKHMGVSQGMVSKWESGNYNFTISTIINICTKLGLKFNPEIELQEDEKVVDMNNVRLVVNKKHEKGMGSFDDEYMNDDNWHDWNPKGTDIILGGAA